MEIGRAVVLNRFLGTHVYAKEAVRDARSPVACATWKLGGRQSTAASWVFPFTPKRRSGLPALPLRAHLGIGRAVVLNRFLGMSVYAKEAVRDARPPDVRASRNWEGGCPQPLLGHARLRQRGGQGCPLSRCVRNVEIGRAAVLCRFLGTHVYGEEAIRDARPPVACATWKLGGRQSSAASWARTFTAKRRSGMPALPLRAHLGIGRAVVLNRFFAQRMRWRISPVSSCQVRPVLGSTARKASRCPSSPNSNPMRAWPTCSPVVV